MKTLIAACFALALICSAHAETCTGRVTIHVVISNGGLNPKGTRELSVGDCRIEDNKRILRTCPLGSLCRVEGTPDGDETLDVISVTRVRPASVVPASAAKWTATPAQWKDIRIMSNAFLRCDNSEEYDPEIRKACTLSHKLQDRLAKQGFCTYGRILVGRPGKDGEDCHLLHNYPMHVLIP